jgi:hypothetical protein
MPWTCLKLLRKLLLFVFIVHVFCEDCQKDGLCDQNEKHHLYIKDQQHQETDNSIKPDISSTVDNVETNDVAHATKQSDSSSDDNSPKCHNFDPTTFGKDNASIFIIEAKGRIGNHLMAYTLIKGFQAKLNIQVNLYIAQRFL